MSVWGSQKCSSSSEVTVGSHTEGGVSRVRQPEQGLTAFMLPSGQEATWASRACPAAKRGDGAGLRDLCLYSLACCFTGYEAGLALLSCGLSPLPLLFYHAHFRTQLKYHILAKPFLMIFSGIDFTLSSGCLLYLVH